MNLFLSSTRDNIEQARSISLANKKPLLSCDGQVAKIHKVIVAWTLPKAKSKRPGKVRREACFRPCLGSEKLPMLRRDFLVPFCLHTFSSMEISPPNHIIPISVHLEWVCLYRRLFISAMKRHPARSM